LKQLLTSVLELNSHPAALRGVQLKLIMTEDVPRLTCIPSALHQVFHNLVQNAINVSQPGQVVEVTAGRSGAGAVVEVIDNGPGLWPEEVEQLFQASTSASRLPTSLISSRFGLYLCKVLVESQGGTIACRSVPGKETVMTVEMPPEHPRTGMSSRLSATS
jgi:signal transduction histidine kinase